MMRHLSALDPSASLGIASAVIGVIAVSVAGLVLSVVALSKVRPVDPTSGWLLALAGLVQVAAIVAVGPLVLAMRQDLLAPFGAEDSPFAWIVVLPACRATVVLSLALLVIDALVATSVIRLADRRPGL